MKYVVQVVETLSRCVIVDAENRAQTEDKVNQAYDNGQIVLDYDDFAEYAIRVRGRARDDDNLYYETLEVEE